MDHDLDLILTLTGGLTAALVLGFLAQRVRLSPIVGYLAAGVAVGPFTPGFVAHSGLAGQLAEIGVILLMFGVGLQFHLEELLAVRKVAIPGAFAGAAAATLLAFGAARALGFTTPAAVVFGLTIAASSTVVLLRVLSDHDVLHTPMGHLAIGWLVVEDVLAVLVLVLLPAVAAGGADVGLASLAKSLGVSLLKIGGLVFFTLFIGKRVIPRVLGYVARSRSRDLFTLTVLVLALGIAVGSAKLFGASMALGAFLAGMVVGQSDFASRAASEALPMRDAFAVLFFVSVGMLLDPTTLLANGKLTLATLAVVLLGKPIAAFAIQRLRGQAAGSALAVSASLAQVGEFSFIVSALGQKLGFLPPAATQALVATAIVTITINPLLFRAAQRVGKALSSPGDEEPVRVEDAAHRAIVVGYGPVGRTVAKLLKAAQVRPTIVEMNLETVRELKARGLDAVYGDAAQREILDRAGIAHAKTLIFAASGSPTDAVIRMARSLNPEVRVLARSAYLRDRSVVRAAGADAVVTAELEVALAMTEHLLTELGATPEQLDRARARVRQDLDETP